MASTKFSAPIRKNSIIGMMVEVERHHKTIGVILTLRKWCKKLVISHVHNMSYMYVQYMYMYICSCNTSAQTSCSTCMIRIGGDLGATLWIKPWAIVHAFFRKLATF